MRVTQAEIIEYGYFDMAFEKVADLEEIADKTSMVIDGDPKILLFRIGDEVFATQFFCTHEQLPLEDAWVNEDCTIECPWHSVRFDLRSGEPDSILAKAPIKLYPVERRGREVFLDRS